MLKKQEFIFITRGNISLETTPYSISHTSRVTERLLFPDILRIIAIFAVIVIHVGIVHFYKAPLQSYDWQITNFFECLVRWGVPVFVMVSEMFFLDPQKDITLTKLYRKNIFRIIVALISWGLLYRSIYAANIFVTEKLDFQTATTTLLKEYSHLLFGEPVWYHMWFLYIIIGLFFLVPVFRVFTKNATKKQYHYLFLIFALFGSFLPLINDFLVLLDNHLIINFKMAEFTGYACYFRILFV